MQQDTLWHSARVCIGASALGMLTVLAADAGGWPAKRFKSQMEGGDSGECSTSHVRMCDGCKINVTMRVSSGQICHISLASPRPMLSHELVQPPTHGRYQSSNVSDAAYSAPQGYTGADSFVLSIYRVAADNQKARETRMNVHVDVVP